MKTILKTILSVMALALVFVSCNKDDEKSSSFEYQNPYICSIYSEVPSMSYGVECGTDSVNIIKVNDSIVNIQLPAFPVKIEATMGGKPFSRTIQIGAMEIDGVKVTSSSETQLLSKDAFTCQAGDYTVTGSALAGSVSWNTMDITITYKPGAMPFEVKTTFSKTAIVGDAKN